MNNKHEKSTTSNKSLTPVIIALILLLLIPGGIFLHHLKNHNLLRGSEYNSVFLSMFPIDTYNEEDFAHFRGDTVCKLTYCIPNALSLKHHLKDVLASGNELRVLYLGVDPQKVSAEQLLKMIGMFPGVEINIIPMYRSLEDWTSLKNCDSALAAYREFVDGLTDLENIHVYSFFTQEWLIGDSTNYEGKNALTAEAARLVYIYTDTFHHCNLSSQDTPLVFEELRNLIAQEKQGRPAYPDLSDTDIVFLGDSVIGSYTDKYSIPEYISAFSGARTYNCGFGGTTACGDGALDLAGVLKSYLTGDLSGIPEDTQTYISLKKLQNDAPSEGRRLIIVLHYGLNDYFQGKPVGSPDSKDTGSFSGALCKAIEELRKAHPDAMLLLIAPNAVSCYKNGTLVMSEEGAPLEEYILAVRGIAEKYDLTLADDYANVITTENADRFLVDEVHPNEYGRYRIAGYLLRTIENALK